jgi:hypothetical protein
MTRTSRPPGHYIPTLNNWTSTFGVPLDHGLAVSIEINSLLASVRHPDADN